jgi:hypothetical protein
VLVRRRLRALDWPLRSYLIGIAMLAPVTATGILGGLAAAGLDVPAPARPAFLVFVLGVFGVLTPAILGMAGKIVPFLAWQWRFADQLGRTRVPMVAELFHPALLHAQFVLLVVAVIALGIGAGGASPLAIRGAAIGFLAAGGMLVGNVGYLVRFIHRHRAPALTMVVPAPSPLAATTAGGSPS